LSYLEGDGETFNSNWENREEALRLHFSKGAPETQLEFAFRKHFDYIQEVNRTSRRLKVLEVGAGRGSLGAHFASAGHEVTLLDISPKVMEVAQVAFQKYELEADFVVADCLDLPFEESQFDLICSIGLLEHFEEPEIAIREQIRVLNPGGMLSSYVVPEHTPTIQKDHEWINQLLAALSDSEQTENHMVMKQPVFRTDFLHDHYRSVYEQEGLVDVSHDWVYAMPMISHSTSFPFTLLNPAAELVLLEYLKSFSTEGTAGWACSDLEGQAFFVNGRKPELNQ